MNFLNIDVVKILATNKKATFNYEVVEKYEAGLILLGWEVKSIRAMHVSLKESYVVVMNNRLKLIGAHVTKWQGAVLPAHSEDREKELLVSKKELRQLEAGVKIKGQTIIPLNIHLSRNKIKVDIALARGKKLYDKRSKLKEIDQKREIERDLKKLV